jgi:hypothetical protein
MNILLLAILQKKPQNNVLYHVKANGKGGNNFERVAYVYPY